MAPETLSSSAQSVRRLAITKQRLAGELPKKANREDILSVVRGLAYVQWDPVTIVAPSHVISLWSRLGNFSLADLEKLLWEDRTLFEHWTPIASMVLTEDYPIFYSLMKRYPESLTRSWGTLRANAVKLLSKRPELRKSMLRQLKKGPLQISEFKEYVKTKRSEDGWTTGSEVARMVSSLHMSGDAMVVGHEGNQNVWGLSEDFLPEWTKREALSEGEFERQAALRAIRALGTATQREIWYYFVRGRYQNLAGTLKKLLDESAIQRITIEGLDKKDERYIHLGDVPLLESMAGDAWRPRATLIAPFDNLIYGRGRTNLLFGFDYVHEQFLPQAKRRYGTYVLPILWGDRLIGRVDMLMDKKQNRLLVNSAHAEPGAPSGREVGEDIGGAVQRLADFLGAREAVYSSRVPSKWREALR
ncbi:MAG: YcaQ family DNA glycosylase [Nitrososphaerota archaeon]|nr:YcaQ family DNA glycosylase [Nitrososphaerota archaeon]